MKQAFVSVNGVQTKNWALNLHNKKHGVCWFLILFEENWGKPRNTSVTVDVVKTKTRTQILQNTKQG